MVSLNTVASARTSMPPGLFSALFQRCHTCLGVADSGRPEFDLEERNYQVFHGLAISVPRLQTSTKCAVCCFLLRAVQEILSQAPRDLLPDMYVIVRERLALGHISLGAIDRERLSDHDRTVAPPPCLQCYYLDTACGDCLDRDSQIPWLHIGDFQISIQNNSPPWLRTLLPKRRSIHPTASDPQCLTLIKSWMQECRAHHQGCLAPTQTTALPDHLIDIGQRAGSQIQVVSSDGLQVPYVALSYCWGATDSMMTTSANMTDGRRLIAWEDLPATFQDAATVARSLDYRYLWIDSLCIIQDTNDLFVQLRKMPDIYQNAMLVISADSSINTISGFLAKMRHPTQRISASSTRGSLARFRKSSDELELLFNDLSRVGVSHRFFMPSGDNGMIRVPNSQVMAARNVVFERAWCFQERLLASRVLHFTADELVWECRTESDCECGWMKNATNALVGKKCRTLKEDFHRPRTDSTGIYGLPGDSAWDRWKQIIATYSACKLTKDADRLLAISAVARQLQCEELGTYYAGLWASAFPGCLLWWSADEPSEYNTQTSAVTANYAFKSAPRVRSAATEMGLRQSRAPTHSRPVEFVAPSWSWASVKGRVQFRLTSRFSFSKILDVHVQPRSGHDIYGQLESASLLLQAPAVKAKLELYHPKVQLARELSALEAWAVINPDCQGTVFLDVCKALEGLASEERDVVCVFLDLPPRAYHGRPSYQALVLEGANSQTRAYRRLGVAEFTLTEAQRAELHESEPNNESGNLLGRIPTFLTDNGASMQEIRIV